MSSANTMSKGPRIKPLRVSKRPSAGKTATFWGGVFEGFSGPLMMGSPVKGCVNKYWIGDKDSEANHYLIVTLGNDVPVSTLTTSNKRVAKALTRATAALLEANNLIYGTSREKILDADGKFRTVERKTIVPKPARLPNEPRK